MPSLNGAEAGRGNVSLISTFRLQIVVAVASAIASLTRPRWMEDGEQGRGEGGGAGGERAVKAAVRPFVRCVLPQPPAGRRSAAMIFAELLRGNQTCFNADCRLRVHEAPFGCSSFFYFFFGRVGGGFDLFTLAPFHDFSWIFYTTPIRV